jgi:hypothetical protein
LISKHQRKIRLGEADGHSIKLIDWRLHTPEDALNSRRVVDQRLALIRANKALHG